MRVPRPPSRLDCMRPASVPEWLRRNDGGKWPWLGQTSGGYGAWAATALLRYLRRALALRTRMAAWELSILAARQGYVVACRGLALPSSGKSRWPQVPPAEELAGCGGSGAGSCGSAWTGAEPIARRLPIVDATNTVTAALAAPIRGYAPLKRSLPVPLGASYWVGRIVINQGRSQDGTQSSSMSISSDSVFGQSPDEVKQKRALARARRLHIADVRR